MKNKLLSTIKKAFFLVLLTFLFVSCHSNGLISPNSNSPFRYSYYAYGNGTDYNSGAISFIIDPYGYNTAYEFYEINVNGVGLYYIPTGGGQIIIPYLWPDTYNFTVHVGCVNAYNSQCYEKYINGYVRVSKQNTSQVYFSPN